MGSRLTGENGFEKTVGVFRRSKCLFVRGSSGREARVPSHRLEARFVRPEVGAVRVVSALVFGDELLELGVRAEVRSHRAESGFVPRRVHLGARGV
jgi:hypothetical protein